MICPKCNENNPKNNLFCNKCGTKIVKNKYRKTIISVVVFTCTISGLFGGYLYYKQHENKNNQFTQSLQKNNTQVEDEINKKISEAYKFAQQGYVNSSLGTLKFILQNDKYKSYLSSHHDLVQQINTTILGKLADTINKNKKYDYSVSEILVNMAITNPENKDILKKLYDLNESLNEDKSLYISFEDRIKLDTHIK